MTFKVFCDTNVPIAYIFHINSLHSMSKKVFNRYSEFFWSNNVLNEFDQMYFKKLEYLKSFFHDLQKYLENPSQELYSCADLYTFVKSHYDGKELENARSSIEPFWNEYIGVESNILFFDIKNSVDACLRDIVLILKGNKDCLKEFMQLTPQRTKNYFDIVNILKSVGVHDSDRNIILDGHDFACFSPEPVDFITFDNGCYSGAKNVELLCFNSVKGKIDFN